MDDLVSVIIPVYNRAHYLPKTLDSVWRQSYRPIEIVIVDDGSIDMTRQAINSWKSDKNDNEFIVKYFYQKNKGAPVARNKGLKIATGRYIQFLDADDLLAKEKLLKQVNLLKREGNSICICDYRCVDGSGKSKSYVSNNLSVNDIIRYYIGIHTSTPLIDKYRIKNLIKWNEALKRTQDIDYFVRLLIIVDDISYINEPLFEYVLHGDNRISTSFDIDYKLNLTSMVVFLSKNIKYINKNKYKSIFVLLIRLVHKSFGLFSFKKQIKIKQERVIEISDTI